MSANYFKILAFLALFTTITGCDNASVTTSGTTKTLLTPQKSVNHSPQPAECTGEALLSKSRIALKNTITALGCPIN